MGRSRNGATDIQKQTIKTGLSTGVNVEILSGITKKDKIKIQNAPADAKKEEKK